LLTEVLDEKESTEPAEPQKNESVCFSIFCRNMVGNWSIGMIMIKMDENWAITIFVHLSEIGGCRDRSTLSVRIKTAVIMQNQLCQLILKSRKGIV